MNPIELLRSEHQAIARLVARMERAIAEARAGGRVDTLLFERAAGFFLQWVEGTHQEKEALLLRAMQGQSMRMASAHLERVHSEHLMGRDEALAWKVAAQELRARGGSAPEAMLEAATRCLRHHQMHTGEEERMVFPLALRLLTPVALDTLRSQFAQLEAARGSLEDVVRWVERTASTRRRAPAKTVAAA